MVDLYVNYWNGDFFVGHFENQEAAEKYYTEHKARFFDEKGAKHGFPYAIPLYDHKTIKDPSGAILHPGEPKTCEGNGQHGECCCDECDYFLLCFPQFDIQTKGEK